VQPQRWSLTARLARTQLAPQTTSMGRLFDAIAALCGLRARVSYEGQAAVQLEAACEPARGTYELELRAQSDALVLDPRVTVMQAKREIEAGVRTGVVASRFHEAVARATAAACEHTAAAHGLQTVALCGGVFQNRRLLTATADRLQRAGLRVLVPERLPPNDGAISYGQAVVASAVAETSVQGSRR
jgi:hydrogenase maturation protein HypF